MLVQLSYLFGGYHTVLDTAGLTLAQYARSGFFELVMVASLASGLKMLNAYMFINRDRWYGGGPPRW